MAATGVTAPDHKICGSEADLDIAIFGLAALETDRPRRPAWPARVRSVRDGGRREVRDLSGRTPLNGDCTLAVLASGGG